MRKLAFVLALMGAPAYAAGLKIDVSGEDGSGSDVAKGSIMIDLREDLAPEHVKQITAIAESGAYDGVVFHRVIDGFMAQTGDVQNGNVNADGFDMRMAGTGASEFPDLKAEFTEAPFERGVVGMARSRSPDSGNSQFFIMFAPAPHLNGQYTVVGEVTEGLDVLDAIKLGKGRNGAVLGTPDRMNKVTVTE